MTELGAARLHGRGVARLHDDWISLRGGGRRKFASQNSIMYSLVMKYRFKYKKKQSLLSGCKVIVC